MTDNKVLDTLGKLKAHMESAQDLGSEKEAQAFAEMIQKLLVKHKLEMTDIQYDKHLKDEPVERFRVGGDWNYVGKKRVMSKFPDVEILSRRVEWMEHLGGVVAEAHSCAMLISTGSSQVWFVGRASDVAVAEYLYITMLRTMDKLSHKEYMKFRRECRARDDGGGRFLYETHGFKQSWLDGFIIRLHQRFNEAKLEMERNNSGTALARINKEALAVRQYLDDQFFGKRRKAKAIGGTSNFNTEGYQRGKKMADSMNLKSNAMNEGGEAPKELK